MHDAWLLPSSLFWKRRVWGCLPFTNTFREIRWKVNGTRIFGSSRKISGSNGTSERVVLFFPMEYSKRKFVFHSFKAIFDTSYRPSRQFFGKRNGFVQMVKAIPGRNLPVLNFANHLPTPWTEWFAHVNGKQSQSKVHRVLGEKAQEMRFHEFWVITLDVSNYWIWSCMWGCSYHGHIAGEHDGNAFVNVIVSLAQIP